jgi:hypothetical protein
LQEALAGEVAAGGAQCGGENLRRREGGGFVEVLDDRGGEGNGVL